MGTPHGKGTSGTEFCSFSAEKECGFVTSVLLGDLLHGMSLSQVDVQICHAHEGTFGVMKAFYNVVYKLIKIYQFSLKISKLCICKLCPNEIVKTQFCPHYLPVRDLW